MKKNIVFHKKDLGALALSFLEKIEKGRSPKRATIVALFGDLGAGKTTFTKNFAKNLGIKRSVLSPTFVIMRRYALKNKKWENFFHIDAYRLKNEKDLLLLGIEEIFKNKENLVFIEWPERVEKILPKGVMQIHLSHLKENKEEDLRQIFFKFK